MRAVHFVIDSVQAEKLRAKWLPDRGVPLDFIDCPDRRLTRARPSWSAARPPSPARR
jgi:hypothetical protein